MEKEEKKETVKVSNNPDYVKDGLDIVKEIFKKPVDTIKKYAKTNNFVLGLILIGISSLLAGIVSYLAIKELFSASGMGLYYGMMGISSGALKDSAFKIIITVMLYVIAYYAVIASMLHVFAGPLFKVKDADIKKSFALVGTASVILSVVVLLTGILMYVNATLAVIVFVLGSMIYNYALYHGYFESFEIDKNKVIYAFVCTIAVAVFVVGYILPKIFS